MKTNIQSLSSNEGLAVVRKLQPVSFNWKRGDTEHTQIGLIAQDVQKVLPEVVVNSGILTKDTPEGMLAMNYNGLAAPLILAMQQLDAKVTSLEQEKNNQAAEIKILGAQIEDLQHKLHAQLAFRSRLNQRLAVKD